MPSARIELAAFYISSSLEAPGPTEQRLVEQVEAKLDEALTDINSFYNSQWKAYREKIETAEWSPFKDYQELKRD